MKLTALELEGLKGIYDSDYRDGEIPTDKAVWTWSANPFASKRTFSGVMSSLIKKGLAKADGEYVGSRAEDACVWMTKEGWEALKAADLAYVADTAEYEKKKLAAG